MGSSLKLLVVLACALVTAAARAQLPSQEPSPATRPSIDALIEQLGDPRFSVRDRATAQIAQTPYAFLGDLVRGYRAAPSQEQRLRLRYAIETVYYAELMTGQVGFLGITPWPLPAVYDPKTGQTVECMVVDRVIDGKAAAQGGMRSSDIILDFEGEPIAKIMNEPAIKRPPRPDPPGWERPAGGLAQQSLPSIDAFTSHVKLREPGTHLNMRVLRAGEPRKVVVAFGDDPGKLIGADTFASTLIGGGPFGGLGSAIGGLAVKQVPEGSWMSEAQLQPGDVIVGIGPLQIPAGAAVKEVCEALKQAKPNGVVALQIRPVEQVKLDITLGARDPSLMNRDDWDDAQYRFAMWWRDEEGEPSFLFRRPSRYYSMMGIMGAPAPAAPEAEVIP